MYSADFLIFRRISVTIKFLVPLTRRAIFAMLSCDLYKVSCAASLPLTSHPLWPHGIEMCHTISMILASIRFMFVIILFKFICDL